MLPRFFLIIILSAFLPAFAFAQQGGGDYVEKVVEIKNFTNEKHVQKISQLLNAYSEDSRVVLSCEDQGWVVLKINSIDIPNEDELAGILKLSGFEFTIKSGATMKDVESACTGLKRKF